MILRGIVSFFKAIITGTVKAVAWILIALGLWLPAIFSLFFFLVCAVAKIGFSQVSTIFYIGLVLSTIISVWHTLSSGKKGDEDKKNKQSPAYVSKIREKENKVELTSAPQGGSIFRKNAPAQSTEQPANRNDYNTIKREFYEENSKPSINNVYDDRQSHEANDGHRSTNGQPHQSGNFQAYNANPNQGGQSFQPYNANPNQPSQSFQPYNANPNQPSQSFQPYNANPNQPSQNFQAYNANPNQGGQSFQPYNANPNQPSQNFQPYNANSSQNMHNSQQQNGTVHHADNYQESANNQQHKNETPRIFLSRKDATLIIYEYSDRLDYYRKTRDGILYDGTRYKHK